MTGATMPREHSRGRASGILFADAGLLPGPGSVPALDPEHAVSSAVSVPVSRSHRPILRSRDRVVGTRGTFLHERARELALRCADRELRTVGGRLQHRSALPSKRDQSTVGTRRNPRLLVAPRRDISSFRSAESCAERIGGGSTVYVEFSLCAGRRGQSTSGVRLPAQQVGIL